MLCWANIRRNIVITRNISRLKLLPGKRQRASFRLYVFYIISMSRGWFSLSCISYFFLYFIHTSFLVNFILVDIFFHYYYHQFIMNVIPRTKEQNKQVKWQN